MEVEKEADTEWVPMDQKNREQRADAKMCRVKERPRAPSRIEMASQASSEPKNSGKRQSETFK